MGVDTWSLREVWKLDWLDRHSWSTRGHKSRNECSHTVFKLLQSNIHLSYVYKMVSCIAVSVFS